MSEVEGKITRVFQYGVEYNYDEQGRLHNIEDFPAIVNTNNNRSEWFKHGLLSRKNGKPAIKQGDVLEVYAEDGLVHREDGPAIIENGVKTYKYKDRLHNLNGPAVIKPATRQGMLPELVYAIHGRVFETEAQWKLAVEELEGTAAKVVPIAPVVAAPVKKVREKKVKAEVEAPVVAAGDVGSTIVLNDAPPTVQGDVGSTIVLMGDETPSTEILKKTRKKKDQPQT